MVLTATVFIPLQWLYVPSNFLKKFHQQFIVCEHLLWPVILGLNFSHDYLIGIDWFTTTQLHLQQGPQSIIVLDPAPYPLHVNQISTLSPTHILVKTISQVTIPSRMLVIVPTTFNSAPKPDCYYNFTGMSQKSWQNLFVVPVLKIFSTKLPVHLLCTIINTSPNDVTLPKKTCILVKWNCSVILMTLGILHQSLKQQMTLALTILTLSVQSQTAINPLHVKSTATHNLYQKQLS